MQRSTKRAAFGAVLLAPASACLDRGHDGRSFEWKNVATSAAGTIRPVDTAWNLCRTPQGWKFAEGR